MRTLTAMTTVRIGGKAGQIIPWTAHETSKCPIGSVAFHPRHGLVRVVRSHGFSRAVVSFDAETDFRPHPQSCARQPTYLVDVRDLQRC